MIDPILLTVEQTAEALSLSRSRVYELMAAGRIESVRIGKSRRIPRDAVARFVEGIRTDGDA